ncbi:MAG: hypothetical protein U1F67_10400 [Rubrivivax sp.]
MLAAIGDRLDSGRPARLGVRAFAPSRIGLDRLARAVEGLQLGRDGEQFGEGGHVAGPACDLGARETALSAQLVRLPGDFAQ